jgi:phage terminase large subunit
MLDRLIQIQPGNIYKFRGAALRLQTENAHEVILSGPSETGKTVAELYKLNQLANQYPGMQGVIIRKVRADMDGTVLQTWQRIVEGGRVTTFGGSKPEWFDYPNGSRVWVGGMDKPGKVLSGERDIIFVNQAEELSLDDWETLTTRTTGRAGHVPSPQIMGDCNPGGATHWIKSRSALLVLESRHEDNPTLYADGVLTERGKRTMAVLDALTGVRYQRLRLGRWVNAEGAVYEFDAALNVVDHFEPPSSWRRIRSIDFGYSNPFVCQWFAIDPDGRMYLYRELYGTRRIVEDWAADIKRLSAGESIEATVADHDAEDRATLERHGVATRPARKEISPGIQAVQRRLSKAGDGRPRLFLMRGALVQADSELANMHKPVCTQQEMDVYVWPKAQDGRPMKETPVKENDHGMDAMRYAVMCADGGAPRAARSYQG